METIFGVQGGLLTFHPVGIGRLLSGVDLPISGAAIDFPAGHPTSVSAHQSKLLPQLRRGARAQGDQVKLIPIIISL